MNEVRRCIITGISRAPINSRAYGLKASLPRIYSLDDRAFRNIRKRRRKTKNRSKKRSLK